MSGAIDERATCRTPHLGAGVRVGAFSVVESDAVVGDDTTIGSHAVIGSDVRIGARVVVGNGAFVDGRAVVEDGAFIGARACVGAPGPTTTTGEATTVVRSGACVGAGATLAPGVEVGHDAVVNDGAVVTRSVPRSTVVEGNPARIIGYVGRGTGLPMEPVRQAVVAGGEPSIADTAVRGVQLHRLPAVRDLRGALVAGELQGRLPFIARRFFIVHDVPGAEVRGEHAHYECHQFLICVGGHVHVIADDGENRQEFVLDDNRTGLYLPPMVWGIQYRYSPDCALLVLASHSYDASDYIRDYDTFIAETQLRSADG
jgi:acetyltransferase-like isoleucine patch superfamily enzyme/dTDP-4-dehydrorhamnose 3,5-epimerase-like enzyme